jgi:hypothetical protein
MPQSFFATSSTAGRAVRTALAAVTACLALGVAASAAQAAATITITQRTQPAGDPAAFTFHLTGPACSGTDTDVTFDLSDGQSQAIPLCRGQAFKVTQQSKAGWRLVDIRCEATPPDPDPADAFIIDIPGASATIELSPDEQKACTFVNEKSAVSTPPAATPTATPPVASPPASGAAPTTTTLPQPAQGVSPVRVSRSAAAIQGPRRCVSRRYTVTVRGGNVRDVTFSVNGRRVATVRARRGQRQFSVRLGSRAAVDRIVARVRFTERAAPRTRTLRTTVRRCAQAQTRPKFTG